MLWKILSGLSAVILAIGLWFSYKAQVAVREERKLAERSAQHLKATQQEFARATELKAAKEKEFVELEKQREVNNAEYAKVNEEIAEKAKELEVTQSNLTEVKKQIAQLEEKITKAGDIEKLQAQLKDLNKQKEAAESGLANRQQQLALADEKIARVQDGIKNVQEVDSRQKRGIVGPEFSARVSQTFPDYGFVVLNKGNSEGVFANALLDVKRGRQTVARLKVRNVEQGRSVADLVPGSIAEGAALRSGDLVVASQVQPQTSPEPTAPAAPVDPALNAPAPATPPSDDPFGSPAATPAPAEGMAPAADPFGAPAAPAPAAPAPTADPFAPAAPAPTAPAAADPFAPAPAAGTTTAPSTVDPFAPPAAP